MRIITIVSDGDNEINQQVVWTGYVQGIQAEQLRKDIEVFNRIAGIKAGAASEEETVDSLLDKLNSLNNKKHGTSGSTNE